MIDFFDAAPKMTSISELSIHQTLSNQQLMDVFGCSPQGGMRRSHKTNTLVLVSNHVESIYDDRWIDGILHYTGMGTEGDQSLDFMQNKTLAESVSNGVPLHLFEVFQEKEYVYAGPVALASAPYPETQTDQKGNDRRVWVFPLKPLQTHSVPIDKAVVDAAVQLNRRHAKKLTEDELLIRAQKAHRKAGQRVVETTQHERNPWVAEYAKRRAAGKCDLCGSAAPFQNADGSPYLETHHIIWLAQGGEDSMQNTVALCPNCHRKMHALDLDLDRAVLHEKYR
jgi:5-methylcytosine-specific restriction protein A